jgi:hypothetical protein
VAAAGPGAAEVAGDSADRETITAIMNSLCLYM